MKYFLVGLYIVFIFFISCTTFKPIKIRLHSASVTSKDLGLVLYLTGEKKPDSLETAIAKNLNLDSFNIAEFEHSQESISGTTDSKTLFLLGRKGDNIIIIPDENNNNRMNDDPVFMLNKNDLPSKQFNSLETLPLIQINNLQAIYQGEKYNFSKKLYLLPDTIRTKHLTLQLISNEQFKGRFVYKGKRYIIRAKYINSGRFSIDSRFANIIIDRANKRRRDKYAANEKLHINDTLITGRHTFIIQNISPFLDSIILSPIKGEQFSFKESKVKRAVANRDIVYFKGELYPYLKFLLDTMEIRNRKDNVLLLNFWFAQCPPCIAEFESLNNLYNKYKGDTSFKLISLTFESPQEIARIRKKYLLNYNIYSISEEDINKLNPSKLFPTNIIIDKNGVMNEIFVGGETQPDSVSMFFEKKLIPKISRLLNPF